MVCVWQNKLFPHFSSAFFSLVCTAALAPLMMLRPGHVWGTAVFAILASVILVVVIIILCATGKSAAVQCVYCAVCVRTDHLLFGVYCAVTLLLFGVYCAVTLLLFGVYCAVTLLLFGVHCAIAMSAVRCLLRNVSSYLLRRVLTPDAPHDPYTDTPTITFQHQTYSLFADFL